VTQLGEWKIDEDFGLLNGLYGVFKLISEKVNRSSFDENREKSLIDIWLPAIVGIPLRKRASFQLSTQSPNSQSGTQSAHKAPGDHVSSGFERGGLDRRVSVTTPGGNKKWIDEDTRGRGAVRR
jgi:hypothetical protein